MKTQAKIEITNLKLRTIIGINNWERKVKQNVIINISLEYNAAKAITADDIEDTVDYKKLTKEIIKRVESSRFYLLEKLTAMILKTVMDSPRVEKAAVRVDKPRALRFADSVSCELTKTKR